MSSNAYRTHPIHAFVESMSETLKREEFSIPEVSTNESYAFARDKCIAVVSLLAELLRSSPPELASLTGLGTLQAHLQAPSNELTAFLGDRNPTHIVTAASLFDQQVLTYFWALPYRGDGPGRDALATILDKFTSSAQEAIQQLQGRHEVVDAQYQALQKRSVELGTRLDEMVAEAARERAESAATVAKLNQTFTERESERQAKFETTLGEMVALLTATNDSAKEQAAKVLVALEDHRNNAARIVQVVGDIGATGNYKRIADAEAKQANGWRIATIGFFSLGIAVAAATFYKFWGQALTTETGLAVLVRLLYALAITAPAWYTARESARHRTNADRARQTELELASIGPFIELMPEEKKIAIREQLTPLYFGRIVDQHTVQHPLDLGKLKDLKEFVVDLAKAVKG